MTRAIIIAALFFAAFMSLAAIADRSFERQDRINQEILR